MVEDREGTVLTLMPGSLTINAKVCVFMCFGLYVRNPGQHGTGTINAKVCVFVCFGLCVKNPGQHGTGTLHQWPDCMLKADVTLQAWPV